MSKFTRREFLKTGGLALAGLTIAPSSILGKSHGHVPPSDRLNIAAVGIGGMGHTNINHVKATENIVALCDVDWRYAKGVFDELPNAKKYWDYRKMYDEMGKDIDAVIIATADHTHAIITADAMTMGKHVYCQKPLAYTISEGSVARQSRYIGYTVSPIRGSFSRFSCHGRASRQLFSCSKTACCSLMEKMAEEIAFMIAFPFVNFNFCMHYTIRFSICHSTCG